ncbi:hypothetical protein GIR35_14790 [Enterococcus faecalis]|nr:hypothetical protein GIR35_14790 [Enterococcus faecalis]
MEKKLKKYHPKPKNEFEKSLFKRFEKIGSLEELNRNHLELWKKRNDKPRR